MLSAGPLFREDITRFNWWLLLCYFSYDCQMLLNFLIWNSTEPNVNPHLDHVLIHPDLKLQLQRSHFRFSMILLIELCLFCFWSNLSRVCRNGVSSSYRWFCYCSWGHGPHLCYLCQRWGLLCLLWIGCHRWLKDHWQGCAHGCWCSARLDCQRSSFELMICDLHCLTIGNSGHHCFRCSNGQHWNCWCLFLPRFHRQM